MNHLGAQVSNLILWIGPSGVELSCLLLWNEPSGAVVSLWYCCVKNVGVEVNVPRNQSGAVPISSLLGVGSWGYGKLERAGQLGEGWGK